MIKFLDLKSQYLSIKDEIDQAMQNVIGKTAFIGGPELKEFESNFAHYQEARHCIGVGNGTDALEIALEALDLEPGSEVIVPANSFISSAEAVTRTGHKVVFCDNDPDNYTLSIPSLKSVITDKTKAIIAVHLYGHPCDMDALQQIATEYGLKIIEDCAQAHGAEYKGRRVGAIGDIGAFSFYPGKNLGAYGDGGALVTNNEALSVKSRMIANHGRVEKYNHIFEGRNSRLDNLQAAILDVKLKYLDAWTQKRIDIADYYIENLGEIDQITLPKRSDWAKQSYHLFVVRVQDRKAIQQYLADQKIQTGVHYPIALPKLQAYAYLGGIPSGWSAFTFDEQLLSLPIGEHLTIDDAEKVVAALKSYYA